MTTATRLAILAALLTLFPHPTQAQLSRVCEKIEDASPGTPQGGGKPSDNPPRSL